jgi:probable F420-dependent oxidoreductase
VQIMLQYPMTYPPNVDFLRPENIIKVAQAAEAAGFAALAFTEHPAPSHRWLDAGGHEAFDPLAALAFCAAVTSRIRLMTYLMVLPYHQPFLAAKTAATVDVLSDGRLILVAGVGYLRSEFRALGVDFDERNALFDEAIDVMRTVWTGEDIDFSGRHFEARGQTARPHPVQRPHPPIWIGGNGRLARERAARVGQGWSPNQYSAEMARTARTPSLSTLAEVRNGIDEIKALRAEAGRGSQSLDVQLMTPLSERAAAGASDLLGTHLAGLADVGVTWFVHIPPHDDIEHCLDSIAEYGASVIDGLTAPGR